MLLDYGFDEVKNIAADSFMSATQISASLFYKIAEVYLQGKKNLVLFCIVINIGIYKQIEEIGLPMSNALLAIEISVKSLKHSLTMVGMQDTALGMYMD